ncbi:MAG: hypothetical protein WC812_02005 [Candidatus Pacearchaeota archaeon]|jgi:hypothetical protein
MINNLSKDLLYLLESIYEEIPNEIYIKDLKKLVLKKKKTFQKILNFAKDKKYILIKKDLICLTSKGKNHLLELRAYFNKTNQKYVVWIAVSSLVISFLSLVLFALPSAPDVYWSAGTCPSELNQDVEFFQLILNNYGAVTSYIKINGKGDGINIRTNYYENSSTLFYSDQFALPPAQMGAYNENFILKTINNTLESISFSLEYKYTTYIFKIIPSRAFYVDGKTFECCYNKTDDYTYKLVNCPK